MLAPDGNIVTCGGNASAQWTKISLLSDYNGPMIRLNIHEAKTHLSRYLEQVEKGEVIVLCRHNRPVAEIRPLANGGRKTRVLGVDRGKFRLGKAFFAPLPPEVLAGFSGRKP